MEIRRIGILTGGGDCPGLNPAIRGIVFGATKRGWEIIGIEEGWKGILNPPIWRTLNLEDVDEIIRSGGTILSSSRTNPYKEPHNPEEVITSFKTLGLDALVAIGGEDTLGVAGKLYRDFQLPIVGIPKTIDFDVPETEYTLGFTTALEITIDAAERLKDTAKSHKRAIVLETMGRHAGWLALFTAVGAGADAVLIPEEPVNLSRLLSNLRKKYDRKKYLLIVVSEGVILADEDINKTPVDEFGHIKLGGISERIAKIIEQELNIPTRHVILGHVQRGGRPSPIDRIIPQGQGLMAVDYIEQGKFGVMVGVKDGKFAPLPLESVVGRIRPVPSHIIELYRPLFEEE